MWHALTILIAFALAVLNGPVAAATAHGEEQARLLALWDVEHERVPESELSEATTGEAETVTAEVEGGSADDGPVARALAVLTAPDPTIPQSSDAGRAPAGCAVTHGTVTIWGLAHFETGPPRA